MGNEKTVITDGVKKDTITKQEQSARGQELTICTALPGTSTDSEHRKLETWVSRTCGDLRDGEREGLRWRWPFKRSECGEENGDEDMTKSSKGVKDREKE
ncbi:hypothetical protein RRG08_038718 [Elysia crispata]|uniref:Uncharacterized protein n=1 Tax=Elysia crispata TaxID=231223 RepID=A0AAE1DGY9_9GAST|nr:hypothetical protein RRG08_038718 [Elysia crispata]